MPLFHNKNLNDKTRFILSNSLSKYNDNIQKHWILTVLTLEWMCVMCFHFHYYIWGSMCSTGPFLFRWLRGYSKAHVIIIIKSEVSTLPIIVFSVAVCLRCLSHHILSLIAYTFRENRDFVFISIVQFMMSANIRIYFGLQIVFVCLYTTLSHYHHCTNLSDDIEIIKCLSEIFCRVCELD